MKAQQTTIQPFRSMREVLESERELRAQVEALTEVASKRPRVVEAGPERDMLQAVADALGLETLVEVLDRVVMLRDEAAVEEGLKTRRESELAGAYECLGKIAEVLDLDTLNIDVPEEAKVRDTTLVGAIKTLKVNLEAKTYEMENALTEYTLEAEQKLERVRDLAEGLLEEIGPILGHIHCDEPLEIHRARMAAHDLRGELH